MAIRDPRKGRSEVQESRDTQMLGQIALRPVCSGLAMMSV